MLRAWWWSVGLATGVLCGCAGVVTEAGRGGEAGDSATADTAAVASDTPYPTATAPASSSSELVPLILVSLDGMHPRYLERGITPTLTRLARDGVRAEGMRPSYPSLTFPNHYTMVTGLRPDKHGIVENHMLDPVLGAFTLDDRVAVGDGRWWGGEPLWVTVERAGLRAGTMFWPGAEADIMGVRPHWWSEFSYDLPIDTRVDRVLGWMALPAAERPRLVTLYFEHVDVVGHKFGPDSPEVDAAVARVDRALGRLMAGLQRAGRVVNLVVVSDHGMVQTSIDRVVVIDDVVALADIELHESGETLLVAPRLGREKAVEQALVRRHPHMQCWRKGEMPARWHYGTHPRVAPIVCQLDTGWLALTRERLRRMNGKPRPGAHGYDPEDPGMQAIFIANGPAFARGKVLPVFDNVHVYPLAARLLGVTPAPNDGDARVLEAALAPAAE